MTDTEIDAQVGTLALAPEPNAVALSPRNDSIESLMALAVERGASVETLERLMAIRRELRTEAAKTAFDSAMAAFQAECPTIGKTKAVHSSAAKGGGLRYKYAPLESIVEQVKALLEKNGFSHREDSIVEPEWVTGSCKVTHRLGHSETSSFKVPIDRESYMAAPQRFAAALTFAKRYAFCAAFGILTGDEDTDANDTDAPPKQQKAPYHTQAPRNNPPPAPKSHVPPPQSAPQPATAPNSPNPVEGTKSPETPKTTQEKAKARMIELLAPLRDKAFAYFLFRDWIVDTQDIEDLPLERVPVNKAEMDMMLKCVQTFEVDAAIEGDSQKGEQRDWHDYAMPFGEFKGEALGDLDRKYLFGWWANYTPDTHFDSKRLSDKVIADNKEFREVLDEMGAYYKFEKRD